MSEGHPHSTKLGPNQNRDWLEKISTPESRRKGGLAACHDQGKHHDAAGCPRCEEKESSKLDEEIL
jgi:hypothetical protein